MSLGNIRLIVLLGLFAVTTLQALFVAPCSHVFHFSCVRPLVDRSWPSFSCPLCNTLAYLAGDVGMSSRRSISRPVLMERDPDDYGPTFSTAPHQIIHPHGQFRSSIPPSAPSNGPRTRLVTTPVPDAVRYSTERTDGVGVGSAGFATRPTTAPVPDAVRYATENSENIGGSATKTSRNGPINGSLMRDADTVPFPGSTTNLNAIAEVSEIETNSGRISRARNKSMSDLIYRRNGPRESLNANSNPPPLPGTGQTLISFPKDAPRQKVVSGGWGKPKMPTIDTAIRAKETSRSSKAPNSAVQNALADIRWTGPAPTQSSGPVTANPQSRFLERFD